MSHLNKNPVTSPDQKKRSRPLHAIRRIFRGSTKAIRSHHVFGGTTANSSPHEDHLSSNMEDNLARSFSHESLFAPDKVSNNTSIPGSQNNYSVLPNKTKTQLFTSTTSSNFTATSGQTKFTNDTQLSSSNAQETIIISTSAPPTVSTEIITQSLHASRENLQRKISLSPEMDEVFDKAKILNTSVARDRIAIRPKTRRRTNYRKLPGNENYKENPSKKVLEISFEETSQDDLYNSDFKRNRSPRSSQRRHSEQSNKSLDLYKQDTSIKKSHSFKTPTISLVAPSLNEVTNAKLRTVSDRHNANRTCSPGSLSTNKPKPSPKKPTSIVSANQSIKKPSSFTFSKPLLDSENASKTKLLSSTTVPTKLLSSTTVSSKLSSVDEFALTSTKSSPANKTVTHELPNDTTKRRDVEASKKLDPPFKPAILKKKAGNSVLDKDEVKIEKIKLDSEQSVVKEESSNGFRPVSEKYSSDGAETVNLFNVKLKKTASVEKEPRYLIELDKSATILTQLDDASDEKKKAMFNVKWKKTRSETDAKRLPLMQSKVSSATSQIDFKPDDNSFVYSFDRVVDSGHAVIEKLELESDFSPHQPTSHSCPDSYPDFVASTNNPWKNVLRHNDKGTSHTNNTSLKSFSDVVEIAGIPASNHTVMSGLEELADDSAGMFDVKPGEVNQTLFEKSSPYKSVESQSSDMNNNNNNNVLNKLRTSDSKPAPPIKFQEFLSQGDNSGKKNRREVKPPTKKQETLCVGPSWLSLARNRSERNKNSDKQLEISSQISADKKQAASQVKVSAVAQFDDDTSLQPVTRAVSWNTPKSSSAAKSLSKMKSFDATVLDRAGALSKDEVSPSDIPSWMAIALDKQQRWSLHETS